MGLALWRVPHNQAGTGASSREDAFIWQWGRSSQPPGEPLSRRLCARDLQVKHEGWSCIRMQGEREWSPVSLWWENSGRTGREGSSFSPRSSPIHPQALIRQLEPQRPSLLKNLQ